MRARRASRCRRPLAERIDAALVVLTEAATQLATQVGAPSVVAAAEPAPDATSGCRRRPPVPPT